MRRIVKPGYVDPVVFGGGEQLSYRPPLLFREVTARVFPLKANIARLAEFCNQYLNMDVPDEIVHFAPALPYVYFMALNYGGMSATTLEAQRLGWVSQHEAFFLVPLERWRRIHGELEFQGWTSTTPFIFVDDPLSMTMGREVYGWPKAHATIQSDRPVWTTHPRAPTRLFTMAADVFHDVYAGEREPRRTLVTIDRDAPASYAEYPLNYKCPWSITSALPNLYATSMSLMEEAAEFAAHLRIRGFPDFRGPDALADMARAGLGVYDDMLAGLWPGGDVGLDEGRLGEDLPRFFTNTVNLKQFRDPENAALACYTSLIDSPMGVDRVNQIGMLGDWDLLRADKSGGYSVGIHRYRAQPILETLGIETPNLYERPRDGEIVTLRPSFPFWMDFDLYYAAGKVICSRTPALNGGGWFEEDEAESAAGRRRVGFLMDRTPRPGVGEGAYNTALGAATLPIIGPMRYPDLTIQVYPLLADREVLARFVDWCWTELFEAEPKLEFELAGSYVYLTVETVGSSLGRMWSGGENIGQWKEREVAFAIPVRWKLNGELQGLAMIEPLVFANKARAVATDREVIGRNSFRAVIESPSDVWAKPGGPAEPRRLLRVGTESFVELGYGLETKPLTLIEIDERKPRGDTRAWEGRLEDERSRKARAEAAAILATQALSLECLARGAPINRLSLKQYRDAAEFDHACYQAVVHSRRRIERIHTIREMDHPPHIALHRLANYPIVQTLGLCVKHTLSEAGVVDHLEPVKPFWLRADVNEDLGHVVATVDPHFEPEAKDVSARRWVLHSAPESYFAGGGSTAIGARMVEALREAGGDDLPRRLRTLERGMLTKEALALGLAPEPQESLRARVDAKRASSPAWAAPPNRRPRVNQLERLGALALAIEKRQGQDQALERVEEPTRELGVALFNAFAVPERETDASLRGADARGLYELHAALEGRAGEPPGSLAGPAAAGSALIGLVKRVEGWIVKENWRGLVSEAEEGVIDSLRKARFVAEYDFDAERLGWLEAGFPETETLRALAEEARPFPEALRRGQAMTQLTRVADALAHDVRDWAEPSRWLRMTREEAKQAVEALDDLQYVFEAILHDGWESGAR